MFSRVCSPTRPQAAVLRREGWALAIKLVGEKHLFRDTAAITNGLASWTLYGGAVGFDGEHWDGGDWLALEHPPGRIYMDDADVPVRVPGDRRKR